MNLVDEIKTILFDLISLSKTSKTYNEDDKRDYLSNIGSLINKEYVIEKAISHFMTKDFEELHYGAITLPLIEKIKQKEPSQNTSGYTHTKLLEIVFSYTSQEMRLQLFFQYIAKYQNDKEINKTLILMLLPYIPFFRYVIAVYIAVRDNNQELIQLLEDNREGGYAIKNNKKLMKIAKDLEMLKTLGDEKILTILDGENNRDALSLVLANKKRHEKVKILRLADQGNAYNLVQVLLNDKNVAEKTFRQYVGGIAATKTFPIYIPYVINGVLSFELNKKEVKIDSNIAVQDIISLSDVNIKDYLEEDEDNIVVFSLDSKDKIIKNSALALTRTELEEKLVKKEFYYECKNSTSPFRKDLQEDKNPYIIITRQIIYYIPASSAHKMVESTSKIFGIKPDRNLAYTTSLRSIQFDYGTDFEGKEVNFTSADHCQEGTGKITNNVFELDVTWKNKMKGGKKRYCNKCRRRHY